MTGAVPIADLGAFTHCAHTQAALSRNLMLLSSDTGWGIAPGASLLEFHFGDRGEP
jgi:hypothetical protein